MRAMGGSHLREMVSGGVGVAHECGYTLCAGMLELG